MRHQVVNTFLIKLFEGLFAQRIIAYGTDSHRIHTKLTGMVGEIGRCATEFFPLGKAIPEGLAESYYNLFHVFVLNLSYEIMLFYWWMPDIT